MAYYDRVPAITVMQRLFVDRWWVNGGDCAEAVLHAGYDGLRSPSDRAKKGRRLLANRHVQQYVAYLREAERIAKKREDEREAALLSALKRREGPAALPVGIPKEPDLPGDQSGDQVIPEHQSSDTLKGDSVNVNSLDYLLAAKGVKTSEAVKPAQSAIAAGLEPSCAEQGEGGSSGIDGGSAGGSAGGSGGSSDGVDRRPTPRTYELKELGTRAAGTLNPPELLLPTSGQDEYGRELQPREVREILANIARGNEPGMKDARSRLRALELGMRNLGMLVDLSLKGTVDATPAKQLTSAERQEKIAELEGFLEKVKAKADSK